jgi:hypothetical protein
VGVDVTRRQGQAAPEAGATPPPDPDDVQLIFVDDDAGPSVKTAAAYTSAWHRLADRAAQFLADPPPGRATEALVEEMDISVRRIPELERVLSDAAGVVAAWPDGAVRVARGRGGVVVRVHTDDWSLR